MSEFTPQEPIEETQYPNVEAAATDARPEEPDFDFEPKTHEGWDNSLVPPAMSAVDMSGYDQPIGYGYDPLHEMAYPADPFEGFEAARLMDRYLAEAGLPAGIVDGTFGLEEQSSTDQGPVILDMDKHGPVLGPERLTEPDRLPPHINIIPPENCAPSPPDLADLTAAIGRAVSEERFNATSQGDIGAYAQETFEETLRQASRPDNASPSPEAPENVAPNMHVSHPDQPKE